MDHRLRILSVVAEGKGTYDARRIDLIHSARGGSAEGTVLEELERLRERGLVERRPDGRSSEIGGPSRPRANGRLLTRIDSLRRQVRCLGQCSGMTPELVARVD